MGTGFAGAAYAFATAVLREQVYCLIVTGLHEIVCRRAGAGWG